MSLVSKILDRKTLKRYNSLKVSRKKCLSRMKKAINYAEIPGANMLYLYYERKIIKINDELKDLRKKYSQISE